MEAGGDQVPAQRALPGRARVCQPAHVTPGTGNINSSVAEPALFWAAPAPEVRGPGADSDSMH